jgi:hypothetical protein
MYRFSAQIARDPNGYRWINMGGVDPIEDPEDYPGGIYLQAQSHDAWMKKCRQTDIYVFDEHTYDPFIEEPALFRIFAKVELNEHAVLEFANQYGDIAKIDEIIEDDGLNLNQWLDAIDFVRGVVEFIDEFHRKPKKGDREMDRGPHVMIDLMNEILGEVAVFLQAADKRGTTSLDTVAVSLLDVMKLQIVASIIERKKYRTCEHCSKPFEVTPQVNRSDRLFCTDNCRVKAYYRRKKQAVDLRRKGEHLRDIVKKTGSDLETVKGWVKVVDSKEKD